jgi:membrane-associated phospholipid phosphatase
LTLRSLASEWWEWWAGASFARRSFPLLLVWGYWLAIRSLGGFRSDHFRVGLLVLILAYGGRRAEPALRLLLPLILVGILYDSQRYYPAYLHRAIHVAEPYQLDKHLFGITSADGVLTPSEWWQRHTHPALDLLAGLCYLSFIPTYVLTAAYFSFWIGRRGTTRRSADYVRHRAPLMMWSFLVLNLIGFATSYVYPAAPPWYVALHGLGPADPTAIADPAGCIRFERLIGARCFTAFYGRSVDVFGAIPSLHVAYPLLAACYAFEFGAGCTFSVIFYLAMCFSALYLNHHYVVDLLCGSAYALAVGLAAGRVRRPKGDV